MQQNIFVINDFQHPHIGYTNGYDWNGWATPYFEIDEALAIMEEYNAEDHEFPMFYDKATDTFCIDNTEDKTFEEWKGENLNTEEGIKHLYGIGAYSWIWEDITNYDIHNIAQEIEDFLYDYNTYEYWDNYDDREVVVETIKAQLRDFRVLKRILIHIYTDELVGEALYEALSKELTI